MESNFVDINTAFPERNAHVLFIVDSLNPDMDGKILSGIYRGFYFAHHTFASLETNNSFYASAWMLTPTNKS